MVHWWYKNIDLQSFTPVELNDEYKGREFIVVSDSGRKHMIFHGFRENIDYKESHKQKKEVKNIDTNYGSFTDKKNHHKYFLLLSSITAYSVDEIKKLQMDTLTKSKTFRKLPEDLETMIRSFGGRKSRKSRKSRASKKSRTSRKTRTVRK
jgi:hypothetical protein